VGKLMCQGATSLGD